MMRLTASRPQITELRGSPEPVALLALLRSEPLAQPLAPLRSERLAAPLAAQAEQLLRRSTLRLTRRELLAPAEQPPRRLTRRGPQAPAEQPPRRLTLLAPQALVVQLLRRLTLLAPQALVVQLLRRSLRLLTLTTPPRMTQGQVDRLTRIGIRPRWFTKDLQQRVMRPK